MGNPLLRIAGAVAFEPRPRPFIVGKLHVLERCYIRTTSHGPKSGASFFFKGGVAFELRSTTRHLGQTTHFGRCDIQTTLQAPGLGVLHSNHKEDFSCL